MPLETGRYVSHQFAYVAVSDIDVRLLSFVSASSSVMALAAVLSQSVVIGEYAGHNRRCSHPFSRMPRHRVDDVVVLSALEDWCRSGQWAGGASGSCRHCPGAPTDYSG
jgi:hypothetical protein